MTEDKAKKKWCPMARAIMTDETQSITESIETKTASAPFNRLGDTENAVDAWSWELVACIASDCMMWRWNTRDRVLDDGTPIPGKGHCGLGGTP